MIQMKRVHLNMLIGVLVLGTITLAVITFGGGGNGSGDEVAEATPADTPPTRVTLSDVQVREIGITTAIIAKRTVALSVRRPGEIAANGDRLAEVTPGVAGVISALHANEGDEVAAGAPLATLESADLAGAQADYFNAKDQLRLSEVSFAREKRLWEQQITAEESYLDARRALQEATIALRTAAQALRALGVDPDTATSDSVGKQTLRSPIAGTVIKRNAVIGQVASADAPMFVITDLSSVWVEARLYPDDLGRIALGKDASIISRSISGSLTGKVRQTVPNFDLTTRTALAIIEVDTRNIKLSPGQFVEVYLPVRETQEAVIVPETALARDLTGNWQVFVEREKNTFDPVNISITGRIPSGVLISGAPIGATLVTDGAFFLRGELDKGALVDND